MMATGPRSPARALAALLALTAWPAPSARAQPSEAAANEWVLVVDGEVPRRYEAETEALFIGSGDRVDIRLDGLDPSHAMVARLDGDDGPKFAVVVLGESSAVAINERDVRQIGFFDTTEAVTVGPLAVRVFEAEACANAPLCADATPVAVSTTGPGATAYDVRLVDESGERIADQRLTIGRYIIGRGPEAILQAEGLAPSHAVLELSEGGVFVEPRDGMVWLNGELASESFQFAAEDQVSLDEYGLELVEVPGVNASLASIKAVRNQKREFARQAYAFCHDETYGRYDHLAPTWLCALLDESTAETCPAAHRSCPWGEQDVRGSWLPRIRLPVGLMRAVLFIALVGFVLWFSVAIFRAGWDDDFKPEIPTDEALSLDLPKLPEARSQSLLRQARDALGAGDPVKAAVLAHLAVLRHLDDSGLARYHPSKTNGDYARAIRRHKPLQALFRRISRQTERIRFGDGGVDAAEVEALVNEAPAHLTPASSTTGASSSTVALLLLVAATQSGCSNLTGRPYHSHAPDGMAALPALLNAAGLETEIGRWKLEDLPFDARVVVFRTSASMTGGWPSDLRLDNLMLFRQVVIIDDGLIQGVLHETRRRAHSIARTARSYAVPNEPGPCVPPSLAGAGLKPVTLTNDGAIEVLPADRAVTSSASEYTFDMTPLVGETETASTGGAAVMWAGVRKGFSFSATCLYVLNARTLFTNAALTRPENAAFVAAFFASLAGPDAKVALVDRLDRRMATDDPDPADGGQAFVASNMLPFLIQGLIGLVLLMVAVGAAFGPLRDAVETKHKAFVDHVEAIGMHYARAGRRGLAHSAHSLARFVVMQSRDRVRAGGSGWRALAQELAEKHDLDEEDVAAALRLGIEGTSELGTPSPSDPAPHSDRMLNTLSRLVSGRDAAQRLAAKKTVFRARKSDNT